MMQRGSNFGLAETGAVVAVDQQRHATAAVDMTRPAEGLVERGEFLEQKLVLFQGRDGLGALGAHIDTIAHEFPPCENAKELKAVWPRAPVRPVNIVAEW